MILLGAFLFFLISLSITRTVPDREKGEKNERKNNTI